MRVRDWSKFRAFEAELRAGSEVNIEENLRIFEILLEFAKEMGHLPPEDPLEGLDVDIKYARIINAIKKSA